MIKINYLTRIHEPKSHKEEIAIEIEQNKILNKLIEVEQMFLDQLFQDKLRYLELFVHYDKMYKKECRKLSKVSFFKPKFHLINYNYFFITYKPEEK